MKYGTTDLKVWEVVKPQTGMTAPTPSLTTFREFIHTLEIIAEQLHMPQHTSQLGSSPMRMGPEKPQAQSHIAHLMPDGLP